MAERDRPNILFLITDQQRADCLGCAGHPILRTPSMDRLASQSVRFCSTYVQAAICGPSRMCIHTGRYMHAHRSSWNEVPLPRDEQTTGTYFSDAGYRVGWVGKSGFVRDELLTSHTKGGEALRDHEWYAPLRGVEKWGFDMGGPSSEYAAYLHENWEPDEETRRALGPSSEAHYGGGRAGWTRSPDGQLFDPADFRASKYPMVIPAEHSPVAFKTNRAMDFMREASAEDRPWMMVVNWFSPHHPWVVPAPYHDMYDPADVPPPNRHGYTAKVSVTSRGM